MSNSGILWTIVAIIVIGGGLFWWMSSSNSGTTNTTTATTTVDQGASSPAPTTATTSESTAATTSPAATQAITYDGKKFSPATLTIAKGTTVTWTSSAGNMWIASDVHPTHTDYDGTTRSAHCAAGYSGPKPFDECAGGTTFSFTFDKAGTYTYHDHLSAGHTGTITVQ
jgi:plastocyanin